MNFFSNIHTEGSSVCLQGLDASNSLRRQQLISILLSILSGDFEFDKSEVAYREKVLKNLEGYIHEKFPGTYLCQH